MDSDSDSPPSSAMATNPLYPRVPSDEGRKLMDSGVFGISGSIKPYSRQITQRILDRELGLGSRRQREVNRGLIVQGMIPSTKPEMIIHYDDCVCCGQFSDDGNFFYACVKASAAGSA